MDTSRIIKICRSYWYVVLLTFLAVTSPLWLLVNKPRDIPLPQANSTPLVSDTWQPVTIGGGGYITGIYHHPQEPDLVYARTDNGGYYRWQESQQRWLPITDSLPATSWSYDHYSGGEALALDPQNPDLVYIAVGKYSDRPGALFKSRDRGATWQKTSLVVPMGGDEELRWGGERLAVSPMDSKLLLFGSRRDGLWRSLDGGLNWTTANLPLADNAIGVMAVAFAPQGESIYASVYDDGIYRSGDRGQTWQRLANSPPRVMQLKVALDGIVYTTSDTAPQVSKYESDRWSDITPQGILVHSSFNGLSLHPQAAATLIISEGDKGRGKVYYSEDRGASWKAKTPQLDQTVTWLAPEFFNDHNSAIAFDPQNPQRVWLSDWFSIWHTDDIAAPSVTWTNRVRGIEQTVLLTLAAPPAGAMLLSGIADQDGFYHHDLHDYPQSRLGFEPQGGLKQLKLNGDRYLDNYFQDTLHIAYCQNQPLHLVRLGGQRWRNVYLGATSNDGGITWQPWQQIPPRRQFMRAAIDPNNPQHFVVTTSEAQPLVTFDGGASWQEVTGLPNGETAPWNWNQSLAADGANGDRFYYFAAGKVYRSDDGGISFRVVTQDLPPGENHILTTVPGREGEFWLSLDQGGLYHATNGGISLEKSEQFSSAHLVTVGKPLTPTLYDSTIYVYGTVNESEQAGLYFTGDGSSWSQGDQPAPMPKTTKVLTASQQQPGLIFAGTDGRGIYYATFSQAKS
ncbi:MAG: hypothetical protein AAF652_03185 [Cyanobacteria bacterium P01_C01_bin.72]